MRKRVLGIFLAVCASMMLAGCGEKQEPYTIISQDMKEAETLVESGENENVVESKAESEQETPNQETVTFETLSKKRFDFASGVGAWGEEFTIERDGYFTGLFHDYDMGDVGESYPDGTMRSCSYSGHFSDITKTGDYTYEVKIKDITYKQEPGSENYFDGIHYIYTDSYIFGDNDTFVIYAPGMPVYEMDEDLYLWVKDYNTSDATLTMPVIADVENCYAAYSVPRPTPYEDAQMTYDSYKESLDYYAAKLANEAETTMDMVIFSGKQYELSDEYLNYLWNLIRYNVPQEKYTEILEEQRAWIASKEARAKEITEEWGGGTFAPVDVNDTLTQMTLERCEKLTEYLK